MDIQLNTGFGTSNKYHKKGDKLPSLKGHVNIEGVDYEVAMWSPKEGKKAFFFKFTKAEEGNAEGKDESKEPEKQKQTLNKSPAQQSQQQPAEKKPSKLFK